jgi:hypothetical protein
VDTEQLRAGDFLLIDRHPAERGLAFLEEEQHAFHAQTHFAPSIPMELGIAQAGVSF